MSDTGSDDTTHQMPRDGLPTGELPELPESDAERSRPRIRPVRFVIKVIAFISVVYFFVLPLLPAFRDAFDQLLEVQPGLLVLGLGLQISALLCYSLLTRAALGKAGRELSAARMFRIQLSTKALTNIVPGGNAAGSALGYRLLTLSGISGPNAGFALGAAGIASAVVLNVIFWVGLIISIPIRGVNPGYGTAALAGILIIGVAAALVFGLMEGQGRSEQMVRWVNSPAVMAVLVMLAMLGAYIELSSPGLGLPGLVAVICVVTIVGSKYLIDMANWVEMLILVVGILLMMVEIFVLPGFGVAGFLGIAAFALYFFAGTIGGVADSLEIVLFVIGVALLAVEIFVTPGFGLPGVGGLLLIVISLYLGSTPFIIPDTPRAREFLLDWMIQFGGAIIGATLMAILLARFLPHTPVFRRIMLVPPDGTAGLDASGTAIAAVISGGATRIDLTSASPFTTTFPGPSSRPWPLNRVILFFLKR